MSILSPTKIETVDYGQQYWNHIFNTNAQKVNKYFEYMTGLWDNTATEGQTIIWNNTTQKWVPSAFPVLPPPATQVVTIGASTTTTVNCQAARFFTLDLTKSTEIAFSNFNDGVTINLIVKQDATGDWDVTFSESSVVGTVITTANTTTWYRCYKIDVTVFVEVVGNFEG
jgi:hypothetical protein